MLLAIKLHSNRLLNNSLITSSFVSFLFRPRARVESTRTVLGSVEIRRKFHRALIILRIIFRLKYISNQIIEYGTSSNLFDLSKKNRTALKRYLFPIL